MGYPVVSRFCRGNALGSDLSWQGKSVFPKMGWWRLAQSGADGVNIRHHLADVFQLDNAPWFAGGS
jgi:hypothetical protein